MFLKRNYLRLIGAESEHLEGKSTTPHYLVNSNKLYVKTVIFL
ncbi:hypothetical protein ACIP97_20805 [Peribacillus frigoritolerans]